MKTQKVFNHQSKRINQVELSYKEIFYSVITLIGLLIYLVLLD